jgi:hypothetical protein
MSRTRTLSVHSEHELLLKLEQGGLTEDDAQNIITSRGNKLAKNLVQFARNGGLPLPANGNHPANSSDLPRPAAPNREFTTWKTIKLGTRPSNAELRQDLTDGGCRLGSWGSDILNKTDVAPEPADLDLVLVTVGELGFPKGAKRSEIYERALSLGLQLCPAEVGPQLRLQYPDQPNGEWMLVAMEPIVDSDGRLVVFYVARDSDGRWLYAAYGNPGSFWDAGGRWVFARK